MHGLTSGLPDSEWDRELAAHGGHFLQSGAWLTVQQALGGGEIIWQRGDGWRWAGVGHRNRGIRFLYAPYGPSIDDAAHIDDALAAIAEAGRGHGDDFVRVEPDLEVGAEAVTTTGARHAAAIQPRHTLVIDLRRSEAELRADLTSGRRRSINTADKKGITIRRSRDPAEVERFIDLIEKTGRRNHFHPHPDAYYRTICRILFPIGAASLYFADIEGESVAGVIAFESATTAYYAHAAADAERARRVVAAAPLAWRIILDARASGRTTFDFWGVLPDDSIDHPWAGFSQFKRTFGGRLVTRPGTFEIPLRRWRYSGYRAARRLLGRRGGPG